MQEQPKSQKPILKKPPLPPPPTMTTTANTAAAPKSPKSEPSKANPTPIPPPEHRRVILPSSFDRYNNKKKEEATKRRGFCRFICSFLLAALLILLVFIAAAAALFCLLFSPKLPVFKLRPVQFNRFSVSAGSDGNCYVDAGANVWLEVKNPNGKLELYYGGAHAAVSADGDVELGTASQGDFTQGRGNVTVLRFVTRMEDGTLTVDSVTGRRLNGTVKSEAVKITVDVKTKVGVGLGKWRLGMMPVDVACGGVSLKKIKESGPPKCQISWFRWG